jgi:hypothetical protein
VSDRSRQPCAIGSRAATSGCSHQPSWGILQVPLAMTQLSIPEHLPARQRDAARFVAAALVALGREEALDRKPRRLLEPHHETWIQFRGRMDSVDLIELLLEDAAVTQPTAFRTPRDVGALTALRPDLVSAWVDQLQSLHLSATSADYIASQARVLGISTRGAKSDLPRVRSHQSVLELPGSGGQLSHHLVSTHDDLVLQTKFTIACRDWREVALAGLAAVELKLSGEAPVVVDPTLEALRGRRFDFIIGLHPDKGGHFTEPDLHRYWPPSDATKIVLV